VLEAAGFHPGRRARDHLAVLAAAGDLPGRRVDEVLAQVDLTAAAGRRVRGFSLGMRQRLGLAAALLGDPEVLVLDEPANGLDPAGVAWLRSLLRAHAEAGGTVLISSHLLAELAQLIDDVVIIVSGRVSFAAPLESLFAGGHLRIRGSDPGRLWEAYGLAGAGLEHEEDTLFVTGLSAEEAGEIALSVGVALYELTAETPSLEEVFMQLAAAG
jgi:ABC-2 type transport system ATP-binding protein